MTRVVAGNSIKDNKALQVFLFPMASQKNATSVVANRRRAGIGSLQIFVEDAKNCFTDACLCASCRRNLTRWRRSCDEQREKYFVTAQSRGKAFFNKITLAQQDRRVAVKNISETKSLLLCLPEVVLLDIFR